MSAANLSAKVTKCRWWNSHEFLRMRFCGAANCTKLAIRR